MNKQMNKRSITPPQKKKKKKIKVILKKEGKHEYLGEKKIITNMVSF